MSTRQTRGATAKATALLSSSADVDRPQELSSQPVVPTSTTEGAKSVHPSPSKKPKSTKSPAKTAPIQKAPVTPTSTGKKRKRAVSLENEEDEELPHGLGKSLNPKIGKLEGEESDNEKPATKKRSSGSQTTPISKVKTESIIAKAVEKATPAKSPKKKANYGHTPGKTPFPEWPHPTPAECQIVHDLLTEVHGLHAPPKTIPAPSSTFAGCGEVPSILDALIRTYLSSATQGKNSGMSIQGIDKTFSKLKEGTGKGSPDYNEIRLADISVLFNAIKSGGLGDVKSKNIKAILDMVYEENQAHRDAYKKRKDAGKTDEVETSDGNISFEKSAELTCANPNVLTLDHMHALSDNDAFNTFLTYPGIGVKTSSCVMLFCMKRPSFAVDTHVFRLCQWLGWVPENATRDKTFSHCEVKIPNELKYGLHQLFIKHGKTCGRCRAITGESSEGWAKGCVIDHLVKRTGARKGGEDSPKKKSPVKKSPVKKGQKAKRRREVTPSDEEEDDEEDIDFEE
ncbi:hypothetical protein G7Y79_00055g089900 [Physcia stellaris]|nr:hypothetical protein G7Y79_00055g089900 [Physcia stellaris]